MDDFDKPKHLTSLTDLVTIELRQDDPLLPILSLLRRINDDRLGAVTVKEQVIENPNRLLAVLRSADKINSSQLDVKSLSEILNDNKRDFMTHYGSLNFGIEDFSYTPYNVGDIIVNVMSTKRVDRGEFLAKCRSVMKTRYGVTSLRDLDENELKDFFYNVLNYYFTFV